MRNTNLLSLVVLCFFVVSMSGCGGGFNCPFDRPSCCSNVVFGCGPFDLPSGCSCSDYFSGFSKGSFAVKQGQLMRMSAASVAGTWRLQLNRTSNSCRNIRSSVVANLIASESGSRVTLSASGISTLRGTRSNNKIVATGQYTPLLMLGCNAQISSEMNLTASDKADVRGGVQITCRNAANNCAAKFSGEAVKLQRRIK